MTFPSPTAAVVAYLDSLLIADGDLARAYGGVPKPRPARLVRVTMAGANPRSVAHRDVRVVIESWAESEQAAERLADKVYGWMCDMDTASGHVPRGADGWLGGPYSDPDPDSASPRYTQTAILRQRVS